jgi:hypothetical protein
MSATTGKATGFDWLPQPSLNASIWVSPLLANPLANDYFIIFSLLRAKSNDGSMHVTAPWTCCWKRRLTGLMKKTITLAIHLKTCNSCPNPRAHSRRINEPPSICLDGVPP